MDVKNNAGQAASKPDVVLNTIKRCNLTSPAEKSYGSARFYVCVPVREIFKIEDVDENLRIFFGEDESAKNIGPVHKDIINSFIEEPERFIQRHSGFQVVCSEYINTKAQEYGIADVTLKHASLINGAQTQGMLKKFFYESEEVDQEHKEAFVGIEVIVEKDYLQRVQIAGARNTSTNVQSFSKLGKSKYFKELGESMKNYNPDWILAESETDGPPKIPTQTLLQVIRAMIPYKLRQSYPLLKKSVVKSYSGKAAVLNEFRKFRDNDENGIDYSELYDFYIQFAPHAWEAYLDWTQEPLWIPYTKRKVARPIGKYDEKLKEFELAWGIACPTLHGLESFVVQDSNGWNLKYHSEFNRKDYINEVWDCFKDSEENPQTLGKRKDAYSELSSFTKSLLI